MPPRPKSGFSRWGTLSPAPAHNETGSPRKSSPARRHRDRAQHDEEITSTQPVRRKYAIRSGSNIVVLDLDLLDSFPDSPSVNRALRAFLAINQHVQSATPRVRSRRPPSPAVSIRSPSGPPLQIRQPITAPASA
ncbi:MAG TPA: hypothetical protein VFC39_21505 [Acidobacteriaceae bacterium]|nr:hypothetical protein [Acidobacteriaceae bacterium]